MAMLQHIISNLSGIAAACLFSEVVRQDGHIKASLPLDYFQDRHACAVDPRFDNVVITCCHVTICQSLCTLFIRYGMVVPLLWSLRSLYCVIGYWLCYRYNIIMSVPRLENSIFLQSLRCHSNLMDATVTLQRHERLNSDIIADH